MKTEDILTDAFMKQFKTGSDLNSFLEELHRRGIEKILEGELDAHLSYDKHQKSTNPNSRNGYGKKKIKTHSDDAVNKSVYLAIREATRKWSMPIRNWGIILNQFVIIFGDRVKL